MAQRHIQLFRNGVPSFDALRDTHAKVVAFLIGADSPLTELNVKDGELVLYRYQLTQGGDIHTIVLAVSFPEGGNKTFEVVANYDHLTNLITDLNVELTDSNEDNDITVRVKQEAGLLTEVELTDNLAEVAHTGNAADVAIADAGDIITATTVEGALVEIAAEINTMNLPATDVVALNTDRNALQASKISETDGKVSVETAATIVEFNQAISSTNKVATMADLTAAEYAGENAIVVDNNTNKVSLKIAQGEQVLSQSEAGLQTTLTVDTKKYPTESTAEGYVAEKAGRTYIQIKGIGGELIDETDAAAFVKDGFLQSVELIEATEGQENVLRFTWNSDAGSQVTEINVSDLCDVYTAKANDWILLNGFEFSHKTQSGLPTTAQGSGVSVTGEYAETKTFKVPQLTVDAAGHVTVLNEQEVSITLPSKQVASDVVINTITGIEATDVQGALEELQGDIDAINAVAWNGDAEINVDNAAHTIKHTEHVVTPTTSTNNTPVKAVVIPQLTVNGYGHVTAIDNKTFNIDCNVTTVSGTAGQIVVSPTEAGEDVNYQVSLAAVSQNNTTAEHNFTDNTPNTTKVISGVSVDAYGRVTGLQTMTINEDYDCGQY